MVGVRGDKMFLTRVLKRCDIEKLRLRFAHVPRFSRIINIPTDPLICGWSWIFDGRGLYTILIHYTKYVQKRDDEPSLLVVLSVSTRCDEYCRLKRDVSTVNHGDSLQVIRITEPESDPFEIACPPLRY